MTNGAIQHNGFTNTVTTDNHITSRGSDWVRSILTPTQNSEEITDC